MANDAVAARPRVQLGIHANVAGRWSVTSALELTDLAPDDPGELDAWSQAGWVVEQVHSNVDRSGHIRLRKGSLVNQAQALLGIEKDGKGFRCTARAVFGAEEPEGWKDPLEWLKAGWSISTLAGGLEDGAIVLVTKLVDDGAAAAGDEG